MYMITISINETFHYLIMYLFNFDTFSPPYKDQKYVSFFLLISLQLMITHGLGQQFSATQSLYLPLPQCYFIFFIFYVVIKS